MRHGIQTCTLLATALVGVPAMAQEEKWAMHPIWWMWGAGGLAMMLMMLAFWAVVIAGLVIAVRWLVAQGRSDPRDRALDILRERYARGEINREEFEAKRRDLGGQSG